MISDISTTMEVANIEISDISTAEEVADIEISDISTAEEVAAKIFAATSPIIYASK